MSYPKGIEVTTRLFPWKSATRPVAVWESASALLPWSIVSRRRWASVSIFAAVAAAAFAAAGVAQPSVEPRSTTRVAVAEVAEVEVAEEGDATAAEGPVVTASRSASVGPTNRGRLLRGARLVPTSHLQVRNPSQAFGTSELVALLTWAAAEVAREHPASVLNVGDLSRERGGRLRPHRSHRVGRDADVGFYLRDGHTGEIATSRHFVALPRGGKGTDRQGATFAFDDARNWTLIAALVGQDVVPVQYIMVIAPLKERLLAEGRRRGASAELLARVDAVVGPQRSGRGRFAQYGTHDSHFHVRIYCSADDRPRCIDTAPFHPWVSRAVERSEPARTRRARPARRRSNDRRAVRRRGA